VLPPEPVAQLHRPGAPIPARGRGGATPTQPPVPPYRRTANRRRYTLDTYMRIVTYKTAFYSFYLPVACGMLLAGITDDKAFELAEKILVEMGRYFQVRARHLRRGWGWGAGRWWGRPSQGAFTPPPAHPNPPMPRPLMGGLGLQQRSAAAPASPSPNRPTAPRPLRSRTTTSTATATPR
jgi:hypothetical protein